MANKTFLSIDNLLGDNAFASASRIFQAGAIDNTDLFAAGVIPSSAIFGTIDVSDGGTGLSTTPTNGQLLIGNGTGYTLAILTDGSGISISEGAGSITVDLNINGLSTTAITATDEIPFYDTTGTANGKITFANFESSLTLDNVGGTLGISNGGTGQTTQTAAFDALAPTTTKGDLVVHNGTDNIRVAVGTNGFTLVADSSTASGVKWDTAAISWADHLLLLRAGIS
jgi:hypothetical protein